MYTKFYGMTGKPFQLIPNPKFLYFSKKHQNALTHLEYGLSEGSGFILLTGDIGAGKTTIIRHLLNGIEDHIEVAVISNTNVDSCELIELVLHEFGDEFTYDNKAKSLDAVFHYLIKKYGQGKRVLLVIDEAQNLSNQALEEVRMLSNLQTDEQILLQIMLVGQPELKQRLCSKALVQLSQRIAVNFHLGALEREETQEYIGFRLEKAGVSPELFESDTFDLIYQGSSGIPRLINSICDTALVYGYAESLERINAEIVSQVIRDKEGLGIMPGEQIADDPTFSGHDHDDPLTARLLVLEEKVASLQAHLDGRLTEYDRHRTEANERLITELTTLLTNEREKTDRLLLEYCLLKAERGVPGDRDESEDGAPSLRQSLAPEPSSSPVPQETTSDQAANQGNSQGIADTLFPRLTSAETSMIDLHCHILPDIDEGPNAFDDSVAMARRAAADGIGVIVTTPWHNAQPCDPIEISRQVSWLNHLLRTEKIPVVIMGGGDVSMLSKPDQVQGYCINGTKYMLVEFPSTPLPKNASDILSQLVASGYKPIITHPERNPSIMAMPEILLNLLDTNIYVQVTAGSLTGAFGKEAQQCAQHLLRAGLVDVLATEAQVATYCQPQLSLGLQAAVEIVGQEAAQRMVSNTPAKILSGLSF